MERGGTGGEDAVQRGAPQVLALLAKLRTISGEHDLLFPAKLADPSPPQRARGRTSGVSREMAQVTARDGARCRSRWNRSGAAPASRSPWRTARGFRESAASILPKVGRGILGFERSAPLGTARTPYHRCY
jgi:hypothetical protein